MSSKEHTYGADRARLKRHHEPASKNAVMENQQQPRPAVIFQRANYDHPPLSPHHLLHLQRRIGNRQVNQLLAQAIQVAAERSSNAHIMRVFRPEDYNIQVQQSERDILLRALEVVMESGLYIEIADKIRQEGGLRIRLDENMEAAAHWHSTSRTIWLNPGKIEQAKMIIAGVLAFELANASQDRTFRDLLTRVEKGEITDSDTYAEEAERIEYESARLRAKSSIEMIREGRWNTYVDPHLRHFLKKGEILAYGFGQRIVGTGLWRDVNGFLQTQILAGHTQGHKDRFERLEQRKAYVKQQEALERYKKRKSGSQDTSLTGTSQTSGTKSVSLGKIQQITDVTNLLVDAELERVWQSDAVGKDYQGRDGRTYRLSSLIEGTFYFKEVLS